MWTAKVAKPLFSDAEGTSHCPNLIRNSNAPSTSEFRFKLSLLGYPLDRALNIEEFLEFLDEKLGSHFPRQGSSDFLAKSLIEEATNSVRSGGFGISAAIVDESNRLLVLTSNAQIQEGNTGLHAEVRAFDLFESQYPDRLDISKNSLTMGRPYPPGISLVSSTEPCPMCLTRSIIASVPVKFVAFGGSDGMSRRKDQLPDFWRDQSYKVEIGQLLVHPDYRLMAHLLFYSFILPTSDSDSCLRKNDLPGGSFRAA